MKRRKFLTYSMIPFLPSSLLLNCNRNYKSASEDKVRSLQDTIIAKYNNGQIDAILDLYDNKRIIYASDSTFGGMKDLERSYRILNKYHKKNKILPIRIENMEITVFDDACLVVCELHKQTQKKRKQHGILTQIFMRNGSDWKIVHYHFSQ